MSLHSEVLSMQHPSGQLALPEDVLSFWFGVPAANEVDLMARILRWFRGGAQMDEEIARRFGRRRAAVWRWYCCSIR